MLDNLLTESKNSHDTMDLLTSDFNEEEDSPLKNDLLASARVQKQSPHSGWQGTGLNSSEDERSTSRFGEFSDIKGKGDSFPTPNSNKEDSSTFVDS